jgi:hypothetical protein
MARKILIGLLVICLILLAVGVGFIIHMETRPGAVAPVTTLPAQIPTEATEIPTTEAPTTVPPTTVPPTTEPAVLYRNPLTGEPLDAPLTNRPFAVVINNIRAAQPLHGIGEADMLFEIVAEGGGSITRCLALYGDPAGVEKIGSVRSARTYLINLARAYDAIFVHAGTKTRDISAPLVIDNLQTLVILHTLEGDINRPLNNHLVVWRQPLCIGHRDYARVIRQRIYSIFLHLLCRC